MTKTAAKTQAYVWMRDGRGRLRFAGVVDRGSSRVRLLDWSNADAASDLKNALNADVALFDILSKKHAWGTGLEPGDPPWAFVSRMQRLVDEGHEATVFELKQEQGKQRGGPGSGHHGHEGRPGQIGGSAPSGAPEAENAEVVDYTEDEAFSTAAKMGRVISSTALEDGYCEAEVLEYAGDGSGIWKEMIVGHKEHDGNSEVAAYRISELLGLDIVPETVFAWHDGRKGTSQRFIPGAEVGWDFRKRIAEVPWADRENLKNALRTQYGRRIKQLITLDYIIGNRDRHNGNWVVSAEGRFWAVDHGHSKWEKWAPWAMRGVVNLWVTKDLYGFEPIVSIPADTLQKWQGITRTDWDAALAGVSEEGNVNLNFAWSNFRDMLDAKGLAWEW